MSGNMDPEDVALLVLSGWVLLLSTLIYVAVTVAEWRSKGGRK